jgi:aminoglycoside phosphotransferase (APT) family kinase protein
VRTRALERLAGLPDGNRLLHGGFHPANLLRTTDGFVVIDWTNATSGDPAADVARTSLLMGGGKLAAGTPVVVERWLPVWAAARLSEDIEPEREFLLARAR